MCACGEDHPGIRCGSSDCYCHPGYEVDVIDMSITFYNVSREKSDRILKAALDAGGTVDVSVHYHKPIDEEN